MFNPFAKTKAKIKDDTVLVFEGWLKLINVQIKNGQISYNINLYSEPTTFCDYLKAGVIADLDMFELAHEYNKDSIPDSWDETIGLPLTYPLPTTSPAYDPALGVNNTNAIKYPFINWSGKFILKPDGDIYCGLSENVFRPTINCKYLLDKMFEATPFTYESNFLSGPLFKKLFMDFNYSGEAALQSAVFSIQDTRTVGPISTGAWLPLLMPDLRTENPVGSTSTFWDLATGVFTMQQDGEVMTLGLPRFKKTFFNDRGVFQIIKTEAATGIVTVEDSGPINWNNDPTDLGFGFSCDDLKNDNTAITLGSQLQCGAGKPSSMWNYILMNANDTLEIQFRQTTGGGGIHQSTNADITNWATEWREDSYNNEIYNNLGFILMGGLPTIAFLMQGLRAQMKQYDFWLGIKQMFNLVTVPDKVTPNNLIIEPYNDLFLTNPDTKILDWTNKIDESNIKMQPLNKIPKITHFTYAEDPPDYRIKQYKNALGGYLYGTKTWEAGDMFFSLLTGEKSIKATAFSPTLTAPLTMLYPDFICSHIYKQDGEEFSQFANKPRIFFDNGVKTIAGGIEYYVAFDFGFSQWNTPNYGQMSHLSDQAPTVANTQDLNFGECPLVQPVGNSPTDNLFNTYWRPYYEALYNPDCRSVKLKIKLTPKDLNDFNFYDKIQIKNQLFRVNKIQYSSGLLATVELILIP